MSRRGGRRIVSSRAPVAERPIRRGGRTRSAADAAMDAAPVLQNDPYFIGAAGAPFAHESTA